MKGTPGEEAKAKLGSWNSSMQLSPVSALDNNKNPLPKKRSSKLSIPDCKDVSADVVCTTVGDACSCATDDFPTLNRGALARSLSQD